jgi:hypothetical protein
MMRPSSSRRSSRLVCEKAGNARRAAATASSTSDCEPSEMLAIGSSVAGFRTGSSFGFFGLTHCPSM